MTCNRKIGPYDCCTVVQGDCLKLMKAIPDGAVDAVITDPPYGINYSTCRGRGEIKGYATWAHTEIANDSDTSAREKVIARFAGIPMAVFGSWKQPPPELTRTVLIWDKGPAFGMGDLSLPWKPSFEEIYILSEGWTGSRDEGVLRGHIVVSWESKGRCHPNEKPVSLIEELLFKLPNAGLILDPFCGSGTTLIAAKKLGRHFLGFEISPEYCSIARDRLARIDAQPNLFESKPEQLKL